MLNPKALSAEEYSSLVGLSSEAAKCGVAGVGACREESKRKRLGWEIMYIIPIRLSRAGSLPDHTGPLSAHHRGEIALPGLGEKRSAPNIHAGRILIAAQSGVEHSLAVRKLVISLKVILQQNRPICANVSQHSCVDRNAHIASGTNRDDRLAGRRDTPACPFAA
jgi:hypothetical protein